MLQSERIAIITPATGLLVYQTDGPSGFYYYNGSGWIILDSGTASIYLALAGGTLTGKLLSMASTATAAGLTLPHGIAPTTPVNGDIWTTTTGVYSRINGATIGPLSTNAFVQNGNSFGALALLGTKDNFDLALETNNLERMRILSTGEVGIGLVNPAYKLDIAGNTNINTPGASSTITIDAKNSQTFPAKILFKNTSSTGDFQISGDGGDVVWQGGGGRNLQMGAYHGIDLIGGRISTGSLAFLAGTSGTYNTRIANTTNGIGLIVQGVSGQTSNLQEWRNITGTVLSAVADDGALGIGTATPAATLDVNGNFKLGASGAVLTRIIKTSVTITDATSIGPAAPLTKTATVTGASLNATVIVNPRTALKSKLAIGSCYVSAANVISINFICTNGSVTLGTTVVFDVTIIQ